MTRASWSAGTHVATLAVALLIGAADPLTHAAPAGRIPESARSRAAAVRASRALSSPLRAQNVALGAPAFVRIFKEERDLEVWMQSASGWRLVRTYEICSLSGNPGPKLREGDLQAPEGFYAITAARLLPASRYHLALGLDYPNEFDGAHRRTGSAIMIHGRCVSIGCFAVGNDAIEEIYTIVAAALRSRQREVPVHVFPFRMTDRAMAAHRTNAWSAFWREIKPAFDAFERSRVPPSIRVINGRYAVRGH